MPVRKSRLPTLLVFNFTKRFLLKEINELEEWLEENNMVYAFKYSSVTPKGYSGINGIYFDFEDDAMAFKLAWT